jgi:predicted transcriptional regulator
MEMSKLLTPYFKQNAGDIRDQRAAIEKILKDAPSTISTIAETTGYAKDLVFWNILAMLRWGSVEVESEKGEELTYKIKEV